VHPVHELLRRAGSIGYAFCGNSVRRIGASSNRMQSGRNASGSPRVASRALPSIQFRWVFPVRRRRCRIPDGDNPRHSANQLDVLITRDREQSGNEREEEELNSM
jgi:hypothetical protein